MHTFLDQKVGVPLEAEELIDSINSLMGTSRKELFGKNKSPHIVRSRALIAWILRKKMNWTFPRIARLLVRDHTSIMHLVKKAENFQEEFFATLHADCQKCGHRIFDLSTLLSECNNKS